MSALVVALTLAILDLTTIKTVDVHVDYRTYAHLHPTRWRWASKWARLIDKISTAEGEDALLVSALVYSESGFDPEKINPTTGAVGLMQVMPGSADQVLLGWRRARSNSVPVEKILDPATNLRVGIRILKRYKQLCDGNLEHAVSSFNGLSCVDSNYAKMVIRRWERARRFYRQTT